MNKVIILFGDAFLASEIVAITKSGISMRCFVILKTNELRTDFVSVEDREKAFNHAVSVWSEAVGGRPE